MHQKSIRQAIWQAIGYAIADSWLYSCPEMQEIKGNKRQIWYERKTTYNQNLILMRAFLVSEIFYGSLMEYLIDLTFPLRQAMYSLYWLTQEKDRSERDISWTAHKYYLSWILGRLKLYTETPARIHSSSWINHYLESLFLLICLWSKMKL